MEFRSENNEGILTITLCQPDKMNPLSTGGFIALAEAIQSASDDDTVDAVILTGEGRAFCVGLDLPGFLATAKRDAQGGIEEEALSEVFEKGATALSLALNRSRKPTVAALNGVVAGAGVGIALGCDVVIAQDGVAFNLPFVPALGVSPDCGATWILPRAMGRGRALPTMLLGEPITAGQALDMGLIWKLVEPDTLMSEALSLAKRLAAGPVGTYPMVRNAVDRAMSQSLAEQLDLEKNLNVALLRAPEFLEGVKAFSEKRKPDFQSLRKAKTT